MTRLVPDIVLPAYSFVPRRLPHPHSGPGGHRFGHDLPAASVPDPDRWAESLHYLIGIDLFNHGYYWEAHEAWESLWNACGRRGPLATFFKALIQWAVVGVKAREPCPEGVVRHAKRAKELLEETAALVGGDRWMGLSLGELIADAERVINEPPTSRAPEKVVEVVFSFVLIPVS